MTLHIANKKFRKFVIVGATEKVGQSTSVALRKAGVPVKTIARNASTAKAMWLSEIGCDVAVSELQDLGALAKAIGYADAVQVILSPPSQAKDTAEEMRRAIESLATALEAVQPKRVPKASD